MDTNLVPVTEGEMREFFERIITTVVSFSTQVREQQQRVDSLSADLTSTHATLDQVRQDLDNLKSENERLRKAEQDAWDHASSEERDRIAAQELQKAAETKAANLQDVIVARDGRVSELENMLHQTQEALDHDRSEFEAERSRLQSEVDRLKAENANLANSLGWAEQENSRLTTERNAANAAKEDATKHLNEIRSVIERMQQATQVAWPQAVSG